jgi:hypothetical protein
MKYPETPECEKYADCREARLAIKEFVDWLREQGLEITRVDNSGRAFTAPGDEVLIRRHFEIDSSKLEEERLALLEYQRSLKAK